MFSKKGNRNYYLCANKFFDEFKKLSQLGLGVSLFHAVEIRSESKLLQEESTLSNGLIQGKWC